MVMREANWRKEKAAAKNGIYILPFLLSRFFSLTPSLIFPYARSVAVTELCCKSRPGYDTGDGGRHSCGFRHIIPTPRLDDIVFPGISRSNVCAATSPARERCLG